MKEEEGNLILLISVLYIKKEEEGIKNTHGKEGIIQVSKGKHIQQKQKYKSIELRQKKKLYWK